MPVMVGVGKGEVRGGKVGRVHSSVVLVRRVQGPARPFPPSGSNDPVPFHFGVLPFPPLSWARAPTSYLPTYLPRYYMYLLLWNITFEPVHYLLVFRAYRDLIQAYLLTDKLHKDV